MVKIPLKILLTLNNINYIYKLCLHLTEGTVSLNYIHRRFKYLIKVIMFGVGVEKYLISLKIYLSAHCTNYNPPFQYQICFYLPPSLRTSTIWSQLCSQRDCYFSVKLHGVTNQDRKLFWAGWTMTTAPEFPCIQFTSPLSSCKGRAVDWLTLEDGTDRLYRKVGK